MRTGGYRKTYPGKETAKPGAEWKPSNGSKRTGKFFQET